jgi:glycosyltransferase involved in cell wall biosynthesis
MAAGLPVIASDISAHRNVLRHGETGMLVSDKSGFDQAITDLRDRERNVAMGEAARIWLRDNIGTWADCAGRYVAAYRQALGTVT